MIVLSKSKYNSVQDVFDAAKSSGGKLKLGHSGMWEQLWFLWLNCYLGEKSVLI